ncbi:MAG: 7-carboxy-7-deazaguanine synthase QueE [Steroidobacteraceae bacterium]
MSTTTAATGVRLRVTEVFRSLQGEADSAGWPTVFVRLTGCPLRCGYCDSAYAFGGGEWHELESLVAQVAAFRTERVCVTGGEPLAQRQCVELLHRLCDAGHRVSLETSGAMSLADVDPRVVKVVDVKTPGSGEEPRNRYDDLRTLQPTDLVKFVITGRDDYEWSRDRLPSLGLPAGVDVYFSPSFEQVKPGELADWILADGLVVRLQLQMHKYLWGNVPGR